MKNLIINKIYVDEKVKKNKLTLDILSRFPDVPAETFHAPSPIYNELAEKYIDPFLEGKKVLVLSDFKGDFLKQCPGTKGFICCNYYVLNLTTNCPLDCTYCILQEYLENNPVLKIFVNINDALRQVEKIHQKNQNVPIRIGTGELTDSLALDQITGFSERLIPFFEEKKNLFLELKTKTNRIQNLLKFKGINNTIISWSLNSQNIIDEDEFFSASLKERLEAASQCQQNGFKTAFHFDPIILYKGWEKDYKALIKKLFDHISPKNIPWISLGGLRSRPTMKPIVKSRFPINKFMTGELLPCEDGKERYFRPQRKKMYALMIGWLREYDKNLNLYFCMEDQNMWNELFAGLPDYKNVENKLFYRV